MATYPFLNHQFTWLIISEVDTTAGPLEGLTVAHQETAELACASVTICGHPPCLKKYNEGHKILRQPVWIS